MTKLDLRSQVSKLERTLIVQALEKTDGNRRAAAKLLGISLRTLFYKLHRADIIRSKHGQSQAPASEVPASGVFVVQAVESESQPEALAPAVE